MYEPTKEVLDRLRDDEQYYGAFGKQYLSNSDIGTLLKNPKDFRKPQEDNPNFHKGRYFHHLILEPEKAMDTEFIDVGSRNTKLYKDKVAESSQDIIMLEKEGQEIRDCVSSMMENFSFFDGVRQEGNEYEVPAIKEIQGMLWKGKADIVCTDKLIDLKTTGNIADFKWSARKYNYDSQCYIYQELFGKPLVFYVVDKTSKMLGIYHPSEDFVERGKNKVTEAIEVYKKFFDKESTLNIDEYFVNEML
jgi:hypothetical protein